MEDDSYSKPQLHHYLRRGWPSVDAVHNLLRDHPTKATLKDKLGDTPLHLSTRMDVCPEVTRILLDAAPEALFVRNTSGQTALSRLCEWWTLAVPTKWHQGQVKADCGCSSDAEQTLKLHPLEAQWEKIILMLRVASRHAKNAPSEDRENDMSPSKFLPLHTAAHMGCPPMVLRHLHLLNKGQIIDPEEKTGRTPLSVAAASHYVCGKKGLETLQELLRLEPNAASIPDQGNRYPLHLAIESGKTWDTGIKSIVLASSSVLRIKDQTTGLFPFMACAKNNCITDAYMLLANCPEVVAHEDMTQRSLDTMRDLARHNNGLQGESHRCDDQIPLLTNDESEGEYETNKIEKVECGREVFTSKAIHLGERSVPEGSRGTKRLIHSISRRRSEEDFSFSRKKTR